MLVGARVDEPVDLLPRGPADIADPDLVRPGPEGEPHRVAQAVRHDPARVGIRAARPGIVERGLSGVGIDPDQRTVEPGGIAAGADVLGTQRSALGRRRRELSAHRRRCVGTGVVGRDVRVRGAVLAVVGEREAGAVSTACVQHAVRSELDRADRVTGEHLTPVVDEHLLVDTRTVRGQHRQPRTGLATLARRPGWRRTWVAGGAGGSPLRRWSTDHSVVRVEDVNPWIRREIGMQRKAEQPAIPEVVDLGA